MQLVLNTPGAYLSKSGDCFQIKVGDEKKRISVHKVQSILITTFAAFSSDAIELAMSHNIDVVFLDRFGNPYGRVWQSKLGSTTKIRRRQLEISETGEGLKLVTDWIERKIGNQIQFLEDLKRHREPKGEKIETYLKFASTRTGHALETQGQVAGLQF